MHRCDTLRLGVRELKRGIAKIRRDVIEPTASAQAFAVQLAHVQSAQTALKQLLKFTSAQKRLQTIDIDAISAATKRVLNAQQSHGHHNHGNHHAHMDMSALSTVLRDLNKAAECLCDCESVIAQQQLAGVHIIEAAKHAIHTSGARSVSRLTHVHVLMTSMQSMS